MKTLISSVLILFLFKCYGQTKHQTLIVAEFRVDTPRAGNFTYLVSYKFEDGELNSKDTILGAETFKKDKNGKFSRYVKFESGKNFIYKKRYVISGTGNVIDIQKKRLVTEEGDDFVSAQGDSLIFHRANSYTGTGFLLLDLNTGNYDFINHDKWDKDKAQRSSPDKKHYLSIDGEKIPYKICLHSFTGMKETIVFDVGHGPNITSGGERPTIETHWLNNHTFLYVVHKMGDSDSSQFDTASHFNSRFLHNVIIREFDINTKSDKVFIELTNVSQGDVNGKFFKDEIGQTIYRTIGFQYYLLDTIQKTLVAYPFYELGNGFSVENYYNPDGNLIRYNKTEIGNMNPSKKVVGNGIIAVEKNREQIKIWSDKTKIWSTIKIPFISNVIGWIESD
ncbi:MAG: hypothetical protein ABJB11_16490 [Ferruginibacter sp.]